MKHVYVSSFIVLLLGAVTTDAAAQGFGRPTAGIFGGVTTPRAGFGDEAGNGWNAGVLLKLRAYRALDIRVDGTHAKLGAKSFEGPGLTGGIAQLDLDPTVELGTINGLVNLGPDSAEYPGDHSVSPHVLVGIGIYRLDYNGACTGQCEGISIPPTENHFGLNFGGGATIPVAGIRTFVEARYHRISQKIEAGGARTFITLAAGLKIR